VPAPFSIAAAAAHHRHRPEQTELHAIVAGQYLLMEVKPWFILLAAPP
jgi:hypothetical protein